MPSLEDVEMSNSSSSEIREVEMEDAGSSPEAAIESAQPERPAEPNGHMTFKEVNGKSDDEKSRDIKDQEATASSSEVEPKDAMPSVEPDESSSPATADEEMTSPAIEAQRTTKDNRAVKDQGDVKSGHELPTASQSMKTDKEIARLREVLAEVSPEAAQKVLKEKWRMFLFEDYDEAHIAFILRAGLKNSNQAILERVLKDDGLFKDTLLKAAIKKPEFVEKVLRKSSPDLVVAHISESTLDYVIAERFKTVPGKTLIKWLATAERLGYKADDILDEEDESVSPNMPSREDSAELLEVVGTAYTQAPYPLQYQAHPPKSQYQGHPQPYPSQYHPQPPQQPYQLHLANPYKDPLLVEQERQAALNKQQAQNVQAAIARNAHASQHRGPNPTPAAAIARQEHTRAQAVPTGPLLCPVCHRSFPQGAFDGYTYHISKKVCEKVPPATGYKWNCSNCLSGFTTKQGLDYHNLRKVCVGGGIAPPTPPVSFGSYVLPPIRDIQSQPPPQTASTPVAAPTRPPMHIPAPPQSQRPAQVPSSQPAPDRAIAQTQQPPIQISRPVLGTPRGPGRPKKEEIRHSPSELTPEKRASLEKAINDAELDYAEKIAAIPEEWSAEERQRRVTSLSNAHATKKSQIRRAHGVSLRMREKDKQARVAAGISPAASTRIQEFKASSQSPAGSPPGSSFSPINSNTAARPTPANGYSGPPQPPTAYRQPPMNAASRVYNPMSSQPSSRDSPLTHALQSDASPSGFGILKASPASANPYAANYHANAQANNKRKHGSQEPIGSRNSTPQLSMMEVSAEDAASKFAKGYQKKLADREREDRDREKTRDRDTRMTDALSANGEAAAGSRDNSAIDISSDSEEVELPIVKSVEVDGDAEESEQPRKRSVGPNMARRGGKH
ncbi:hypothetical protein BKA65DRAFT_287990 [Rhexocercosporidium sp. MPI-PUGE-AT-0058]|nr:hypothetical protein BKA65DRAFT_287990 [Rhexocercosporidium sp. MPI-PUGE-AT-0058]